MTTAFDLATRYIWVKEIAGIASNELILKMLKLDHSWPEGDHVPWCSAFVNYIAWQLDLPRSKSLRARSWLKIGQPININIAKAEYDIVIMKRGKNQPGPEIIDAPGHVGFFEGFDDKFVYVLGGNQSDEVNISAYRRDSILGIRRIK